jgi:predicted PurR-regulated permease PerM
VLAGVVAAAREVVLLVFQPCCSARVEYRGAPSGAGPGSAEVVDPHRLCHVLAGVVAIAVFIVPAAIVQLGGALGHLPAFLDRVRPGCAAPPRPADGIGALSTPSRRPSAARIDSVLGVSLLVGQVSAALMTLLALVFFWLTERSRLQRYALAFLPAHRRGGIRDAWNEVETRLGLWVRGQLVLMAAIGVATGIAYSLLGLPAALLLALVAALTEVIPIVGPLIGAVPAVLVATTISPETVLLTIGIYVVLQLIEGNVLVPMIMRNTVGLSPFLVLVSLLVGGAVAGVLGAIVAVPIAAGITVVLERLQDRDTVPIDPVAGVHRCGKPSSGLSRRTRPLRRRRRPPPRGPDWRASAALQALRRLAHQADVVAVEVADERQPQVVRGVTVRDLGLLADRRAAGDEPIERRANVVDAEVHRDRARVPRLGRACQVQPDAARVEERVARVAEQERQAEDVLVERRRPVDVRDGDEDLHDRPELLAVVAVAVLHCCLSATG